MHTDDEEGSEEGDERNISERGLEAVTGEMVIEGVAGQTSKAGKQEGGNEDVDDGNKDRQGGY